MNTVAKYASLVRFAHTIFAMPFALMAFVHAAVTEPGATCTPWLLAKVILCMVFARNTAMGFNRWADRRYDAANPRTANREIPAGVVTPRAAMTFVLANALLFVAVAATINPLAATLSPAALCIVTGYSLCKRFTSAAHLVLGLSLAIAPVGATIAVTGRITEASLLLALLVLTWCGGFDIIYALQDADFDRAHGLHSIPARFGTRGALHISILLHACSAAALLLFARHCPQGPLLWTGVGVFLLLLALQHVLVTPTRQRRIAIAFGTLNGLASLALALFVIADLLLRA
ncbi:4-hydroxybenzoate octaprenyltransferase [uncultured Alistipes sp.]|uniref:4-hydroxybenzoate octaprenyltransferase n=1 Tax=uncultured Alistipes sp. TaxID=538949 RepID=UPI00263362F5|nr:4-hydroxybenzoate octaprenyltransferase [uncultured Alistipes sp.]